MAKQPKTKPQTQTATKPEPDQALVLFGGMMHMLPKELEQMGLSGKVEAREISGVAPNWKPVQPGDFLLGRCVDTRMLVFDAGTPKERKAQVLVFETAVPGGFRSVWLGADLRIKLSDPLGKVYSIYYDGETTPNDTSRKLNPMKTYRVFEVLPKDIAVPEDAKQVSG